MSSHCIEQTISTQCNPLASFFQPGPTLILCWVCDHHYQVTIYQEEIRCPTVVPVEDRLSPLNWDRDRAQWGGWKQEDTTRQYQDKYKDILGFYEKTWLTGFYTVDYVRANNCEYHSYYYTYTSIIGPLDRTSWWDYTAPVVLCISPTGVYTTAPVCTDTRP